MHRGTQVLGLHGNSEACLRSMEPQVRAWTPWYVPRILLHQIWHELPEERNQLMGLQLSIPAAVQCSEHAVCGGLPGNITRQAGFIHLRFSSTNLTWAELGSCATLQYIWLCMPAGCLNLPRLNLHTDWQLACDAASPFLICPARREVMTQERRSAVRRHYRLRKGCEGSAHLVSSPL